MTDHLLTVRIDGIPAPKGSKKHVPVSLEVWFLMPRPQKPRHDVWHVTTPDLDKLVRAIGDTLTGPVIYDDGQIVHTDSHKMYAPTPLDVGAVITLRHMKGQTL